MILEVFSNLNDSVILTYLSKSFGPRNDVVKVMSGFRVRRDSTFCSSSPVKGGVAVTAIFWRIGNHPQDLDEVHAQQQAKLVEVL